MTLINIECLNLAVFVLFWIAIMRTKNIRLKELIALKILVCVYVCVAVLRREKYLY